MLSQAFLRLLVYRAGTTLSYQILAVTAGWHLYSITHDVLSLGLLGLAEVLPYFCSSLFAGTRSMYCPNGGWRWRAACVIW